MAEGIFNEDKSGKPRHLELYHVIHNSRPDYTRPLLKVPAKARKRMLRRPRCLYRDAEAERWMPELERIMRVYFAHKPERMIELEKDFDPQERFVELERSIES